MSYKVRLDIFEGPLDLLLYLIKKEELNIYDIPITRITEQYLEYLNLMELLDLEIAGDFLLMAATLMQIKSKMLLPPDPEEKNEEDLDPRGELVRRLLEYKAFKEAAESLRQFEERRSQVFTRLVPEPQTDEEGNPVLELSLFELVSAFSKLLKGLPKVPFHQVLKDEFTVAEKIEELSRQLTQAPKLFFSALFKSARNKFEVITVFLAVLELIRLKKVRVVQSRYFDEIEISRREESEETACIPMN